MEDSATPVIPLSWSWDYHASDQRIRSLYDKTVADQWSAAEALDWSVPIDPVRAGHAIGGSLLSSGLAAQLSAAKRDRLAAGMGAMSLSQLLHGEQRRIDGLGQPRAAASKRRDEAGGRRANQ